MKLKPKLKRWKSKEKPSQIIWEEKIKKLRTKLINNRITITDIKYFNMEKELSLKQTELKDAFVKHQKELE